MPIVQMAGRQPRQQVKKLLKGSAISMEITIFTHTITSKFAFLDKKGRATLFLSDYFDNFQLYSVLN